MDNLSPIVPVVDNFDRLLTPKDHPSRSKSDTYYVSDQLVLRSHMTAHNPQRLSQGERNFLSVGDVYRKDETNVTHYPVFHQIDGVGEVPIDKVPIDYLMNEILSGLVKWLFGEDCQYRINDDEFPFTQPSREIEVLHNGEWLEILGGGILHREITKLPDTNLWAFGIGLERLCMILFEIPDIRCFWSTHPRFLNQFNSKKIVKFKRYSELPNQSKDISFWIPSDQLDSKNGRWLQDNDFYELGREICGDNIESITIMDQFYHKKKQRHSRTYKLIYSPVDPDLKDSAKFTKLVNDLQNQLRKEATNKLDIELR